MMRRLLIAAIGVQLVAGCGGPTDSEGLTAAENRELDEAAARLEAAQENAQLGVPQAEEDQPAPSEDDESEH